MMTYEEVWKN